MVTDDQVEDFLEHYGVKGMRWGSTQLESLDRIYRMEAGTTSRKENSQKKAKKQKRQNGSDFNKLSLEDFLGKVGGVRLSDIVLPDQ